MTKQEFIKEVWAIVNSSGALIMDVVVELAEKHNIDIETAGKIVASSAPLKQLLEHQSRELRLVVHKEHA